MNIAHDVGLLIQGRTPGFGRTTRAYIEDRDRKGYVLHDGTLLLLGVSSPFQFFRVMTGVRAQGAQSDWHQYIETYARDMVPLIERFPVRRLLGHSLGGGAAQYLAVTYGLPALTFAAPRIYRGPRRWVHREADILNVVRVDDPAQVYLAGSRYRRLGRTFLVRPGEKQSNGSHRMSDYLRVIDRIRPGRAERPVTRMA